MAIFVTSQTQVNIMGLKESLKELQEKEKEYAKISLKREVKKELTKIKNSNTAKKKCVMCGEDAKYSIKGSSDCYCKDCAIEYFGDTKSLKKVNSPSTVKKKMKKIYMITGNTGKFIEVKMMLPYIEKLNIDLAEIQEIDAKKIIEAKLAEAKKHHKGAFIVEDSSLCLECLNGLPGPLIKWFEQTIKLEGIYNLTLQYGNDSAVAKTIIGFSDGKTKFFEGIVHGRIVKPDGERGFGWDKIFIPDGYSKRQSEMTLEEKNLMSTRRIAIDKLKEYVSNKYS